MSLHANCMLKHSLMAPLYFNTFLFTSTTCCNHEEPSTVLFFLKKLPFIFNQVREIKGLSLLLFTEFHIFWILRCFIDILMGIRKRPSTASPLISKLTTSSIKQVLFQDSNHSYPSISLAHTVINKIAAGSSREMFLPTTTVLIVALGAGTLALPADSISLISPSVLEERGFNSHGLGSIAGFKEPDCTGDPVGDRPLDRGLLEGKDNCIVFSSDMTNMIGINWGDTGHYIVKSLYVYSDTTCTNRVDDIEAKKIRKRGKGPSTNSCVSQKDHGGPWGSVKYIHEAICSDANASNGVCAESNVSALKAREPTDSEPGALASPTSDNDPLDPISLSNLDERALEKRGMGSIAAFESWDCTGNPDESLEWIPATTAVSP